MWGCLVGCWFDLPLCTRDVCVCVCTCACVRVSCVSDTHMHTHTLTNWKAQKKRREKAPWSITMPLTVSSTPSTRGEKKPSVFVVPIACRRPPCGEMMGFCFKHRNAASASSSESCATLAADATLPTCGAVVAVVVFKQFASDAN